MLVSFHIFPGGYNHLRSPVCQDENQRDETSPPPHSHNTQAPNSHSTTPNSNNNNNNNNNANNAYIHLRNLNQLKTECKYFHEGSVRRFRGRIIVFDLFYSELQQSPYNGAPPRGWGRFDERQRSRGHGDQRERLKG